ncbi:MAG: hypothetical protein JJE03_00365 [Peptostreptococcaceae bacterium]|nr:hypothetical protein [Peptostreptococcaceae bacterium]
MDVIILSNKELKNILEMSNTIESVEAAYKLKTKGETASWPLVEHQFEDLNAVTDIRSGGVFGHINLHGLKMLNKFPLNNEKNLPIFTGMLMVFDSRNGLPLGIMDASHITCMRTGAAGAIGARALARANSETLFMLGAGKQSIFQIAATLIAIPKIKKVYIADVLDVKNAEIFASSCGEQLKKDFNIDSNGVEFIPVYNIQDTLGESDIVITITPAREPVIKKEWIRAGTHLSCIGADMVGKEEIEPEIFIGARVYCDDVAQCEKVGELEIPMKMGIVKKEDIIGEIGQVLSGEIEGRKTSEDITIFDATGLAILDLVTAKSAIDIAKLKGFGTIVEV